MIKDPELAYEAERARRKHVPARESRQLLRREIEQRYILAV
jgi:hypothetical protein